MKRIIILLAAMLGLAACQSVEPKLIQRQLVVVTPPERMYECPIEKQYPNWATLNDVEVAKTVLRLHKNNVTCKRSIEAIKKFLKDAKVELEQKD